VVKEGVELWRRITEKGKVQPVREINLFSSKWSWKNTKPMTYC
jgi:hypothetical protein